MLLTPDPRGMPDEERLREDTARIVTLVESRTGLKSRWSGVIEISDASDSEGNPLFLGQKKPHCPIEYHRIVVGDVEVYYVCLEEALHSCSVLRPTDGVDLFSDRIRNIEEATVACCFALLKPEVRVLFGGENPLPDTSQSLFEEKRMRALGQLRRLAGMEREPFFFGLLGTPIARRRDKLIQWVAREDSSIAELLAIVENN